MYNDTFPRQALPKSKKTKEWAKKCVMWASTGTILNSSLIRKTVAHKKLNYDLLSGKLNMRDLASVINPSHFDDGMPLYKIQHYPIMNVKLDLLRGEEEAAQFDFKVVVTNPNAISEIEENKKAEIMQRLQTLAADTALSEEDYQKKIEALNDYYLYDWQDMREIRANCLLNHYYKELNMPQIFNEGFMDVLAVKEEIYRCSIVNGEPTLERLNPEKVRIYRSGYSTKIEDADIIAIEDYWQPGRIIDTFYEELTEKQIKQIENYNKGSIEGSSEDKYDECNEYIMPKDLRDTEANIYTDKDGFNWVQFADGVSASALPYDLYGNIRVLQVYWKSLRKIKKVKRYDQQTGEPYYEFFPETYICNTDLGEEEKIYFINEAWEGTMIGSGEEAIFINMHPRKIQDNRIFNPSRCHFGIVGSIYNLNDQRPYSMVDMMKPYNYLYDVIQDRLNKLIARNMGKLVRFDFATAPAGWSPEQWLYYIKTSGLLVTDSFKEGTVGAAKGKLAGMLNNPQTVIDAELGNSIQQYINLLEFIKLEMADIVGISKQREGNIQNRETVGGVERATLQSSYITRWMFAKHNDVKKRVLECFLETAKIALRGNNKKFQYITSDGSQKIMEIDGDVFAECDYGLVVDASQDTVQLNQKIDMIAQAAMQNQAINFSTYLRIAENCSLADKIRMVEKNERQLQQQQQQQIEQQNKIVQEANEQKTAVEMGKLESAERMNTQDNETKLIIANMQKINEAEDLKAPEEYSEAYRRKLEEQIREFDLKNQLEIKKHELDKQRLEFDKNKAEMDNQTRLDIAKRKLKTTSNK